MSYFFNPLRWPGQIRDAIVDFEVGLVAAQDNKRIEDPPPESVLESVVGDSKRPASLQNHLAVRLFSEQCGISNRAASPLEFMEPSLVSVGVAEFHLSDDAQRCTAEKLDSLLNNLSYAAAEQNFSYGVALYEEEQSLPKGSAGVRDLTITLRKLEKHPELTQAQKIAIKFLRYGQPISLGEAQLFFEATPDLLKSLQGLGLVVAENKNGEIFFRTNDLSLTAQRLPHRQNLHLWVELPASLRSEATGGEATAQFHGTGLKLLDRLVEDYQLGKKHPGVVADFGAGTGIQALALLKMHPEITEAISLEIDPSSMNLHRLNAMMNGVADRVQVVDNSDTTQFAKVLAGRPLEFAVSNPPFNTVPHELAERFTNFGDGGDHGIDVTKIFLAQALPHLKKDGEFLLYSVLAEDQKNEFFLSRHLQEQFKGLTVQYSNLRQKEVGSDLTEYSRDFARFIVEHDPASARLDIGVLAKQFEDKLRERQVHQFREKYIRIVNQADESPVTVVNRQEPTLRVELNFESGERPGGVFVEMMQNRGGVWDSMQSSPSAEQRISMGKMQAMLEEYLRQNKVPANSGKPKSLPKK